MAYTQPTSATLAQDFANEFGNDVMQEQVKLKAPTWRMLKKIDCQDDVAVVQPIQAAQATATRTTDMGTRPAGGARQPVKGFCLPAFQTCSLKLSHGSKYTNGGGGKAANWIASEYNAASDSLAHAIGQSLFLDDGLISSISGALTFSSGIAEAKVPLAAGLKPGMAVSLLDSSTGKAWLLQVGYKKLHSDKDGSFTVQLRQDVPLLSGQSNPGDITVADGYASLYQRGALTQESTNVGTAAVNSNTDMVSLSDLASDASVYSISQDNCKKTGFVGNTFASFGDVFHEKVIANLSVVEDIAGSRPDTIIMNPATAVQAGFAALTQPTAVGAAFGSISVGNTQKMLNNKLDKYGNIFDDNSVEIGGIKIIRDGNVASDRFFVLDSAHTKIALWHDVMAESDDGGRIHLSQTELGSQIHYTCMFNLFCDKRSTVAAFTGITRDIY